MMTSSVISTQYMSVSYGQTDGHQPMASSTCTHSIVQQKSSILSLTVSSY